MLCSVALSNYTLAGNYVREVEGLTMLMSYIFAHAERHHLESREWQNEFTITVNTIYDRLMCLQRELSERGNLIEGEPWTDPMFVGARVTMCIGYMSILGLWRIVQRVERDSIDEHIRCFCEKYRRRVEYWGESATPFFLALFWFLEHVNGCMDSDLLIRDMLNCICTQNKPLGEVPLPNPYYSYEEIVEHVPGLGETPIRDSFAGRSCTATGLLHVIVRRNLKQSAKSIWPDYSRIVHEEYVPRPKWQFYRWRNRSGGTNRMVYPPLTKHWDDLQAEAYDTAGRNVPRLIRNRPELLLLLLCVYPHRLTAEVARWMDAKLGKAWKQH